MRNFTFIIITLYTAFVSVQNSFGQGKRAGRHFLQNAALWQNPKSAPPAMRDYLQRWLNPGAAFTERAPHNRLTRHAQQKNLLGKFKTSRRNHLAAGVREAWVNHYASGLAPSVDEMTAMSVDVAGNVYVTGYGANLPFQPDYLTAKYDAAGNQVWSVRYNGSAGAADLAFAICVDGSGNVYVTGSSAGNNTNYDYATIKYNTSGIEQWMARYNGLGNADDAAYKIAVDNSGNVYVTGSSAGNNTNYDYATIKYNAFGIEQWTARYNGLGNAEDAASDIAIDASANVYVTGTSIGVDTEEDYATIKYNAAGTQQWVARYNGPKNNGNDEAAALAIDRAGNVFVTGVSEGAATSEDYATIKYNSAGEQQWLARYNGPSAYGVATALALDNLGNVYVTGMSDSTAFNADYTTIKYNESGAQQWLARYNGPANDSDEARSLAVDAAGNVYVTGTSFGSNTERDYATIKYNAAGVRQWLRRYNNAENKDDLAAALAIDGAGNVCIAGTSQSAETFADFALIKYNNAGTAQWAARYNTLGNADDQANAVALDAAGNVYVTGRSRRAETGFDFLTIKFNAAGIRQWVARYNGPGNGWDEPLAIAVDDAGNVYVTGKSLGAASAFDYATIKYNNAGAELWRSRYNGASNGDDEATALVVDPVSRGGSVYVTGSSAGADGKRDYATAKYNAAGAQQWVARYNGTGNDNDQAVALRVDAAGNVYVTGNSRGIGAAFDYATIKYNNAGLVQWIGRYNGSGNDGDLAAALAVDLSGNVYVAGSSIGANTFADCVTIKYNSIGAEQWTKRYDDAERPFNMAAALAVDRAGNVIVTGTSWGPVAAFDYATIKYNTAGEQQWAAIYNGPESDADHVTALALDDSGHVYVTGWSAAVESFSDCATVKYNTGGAEQWLARYGNVGAALDYATSLAVDSPANGRNVYIAGWSEGENWSKYTVIKYVQTPPVSVQERNAGPHGYKLLQNYPNPFSPPARKIFDNPATMIRYELPAKAYVTLAIYDLAGRRVRDLASGLKEAGEHVARWDGYDYAGRRVISGIYFYRLEAKSLRGEVMISVTNKMMVLR